MNFDLARIGNENNSRGFIIPNVIDFINNSFKTKTIITGDNKKEYRFVNIPYTSFYEIFPNELTKFYNKCTEPETELLALPFYGGTDYKRVIKSYGDNTFLIDDHKYPLGFNDILNYNVIEYIENKPKIQIQGKNYKTYKKVLEIKFGE